VTRLTDPATSSGWVEPEARLLGSVRPHQ
jgi:hypothetical protein